MERLRLRSGAPWRELELAWRERRAEAPRRIVARASGWWRGGELPDRWAAWVEFADGRVWLVECAPGASVEESAPRRGFTAGEVVAQALRSA